VSIVAEQSIANFIVKIFVDSQQGAHTLCDCMPMWLYWHSTSLSHWADCWVVLQVYICILRRTKVTVLLPKRNETEGHSKPCTDMHACYSLINHKKKLVNVTTNAYLNIHYLCAVTVTKIVSIVAEQFATNL